MTAHPRGCPCTKCWARREQRRADYRVYWPRRYTRRRFETGWVNFTHGGLFERRHPETVLEAILRPERYR